MKTLALLAAILLLWAGSSPAQIAWWPNSAWIYFDQEGTSITTCPAPFSMVNAYVMAGRLTSASGLLGWECTVLIDPPAAASITSYTIAGGGTNTLSPPYFNVNLQAPLNGSPVLLMTISTLLLSEPIHYGLGPCYPSSHQFSPYGHFAGGYVSADDPGVFVPFNYDPEPWWWAYPEGVSFGFFLASVCDRMPVAARESSWGNMKALYR